MTCQMCGSDEGKETICPYDQDVHNKETEVVYCDSCYKEAEADI